MEGICFYGGRGREGRDSEDEDEETTMATVTAEDQGKAKESFYSRCRSIYRESKYRFTFFLSTTVRGQSAFFLG